MVIAAIWKIKISQYLCFGPVLKKICHGDVSRSSQPHQHIKIQHGGQLPSGKYKNMIYV